MRFVGIWKKAYTIPVDALTDLSATDAMVEHGILLRDRIDGELSSYYRLPDVSRFVTRESEREYLDQVLALGVYKTSDNWPRPFVATVWRPIPM